MGKIRFLAAAILIICNLNIVYSQNNIKTVAAVKVTNKAPEIDGDFNDYEWNYGSISNGFIQQNPYEGEKPTDDTEIYFLYDEENLYIGVKCFVKDSKNFTSSFTSRDQAINTDYLRIFIDTFHDHINAYSFTTSPSGARLDSYYSGNGLTEDVSWNGIWWVESKITDYGWTAEFKIPFSTLKFNTGTGNLWGLNVLRYISGINEVSYWSPMKRDDFNNISKFGHLEIQNNIKQGTGIEILPYLTTKFKKDRITPVENKNDNGISGFDLKYSITSNFNTVFTVNPDFAQIEADENLLNLTRYPLYYPEKRPFFTEGASVFNTAGSKHNASLFYSRRINEPVYGLKTTGKLGRYNIGILHTYNKNDLMINSKIDAGELPANTKNKAFYNIIRISRDIFSRSEIGLIAMSKEYSGNYSRIIGIDGTLRWKNNYNIFFEAAKTYLNGINSKNHSFSISFYKQGDVSLGEIAYFERAPDFAANDLGFYDYSNCRGFEIWWGIKPRIEKWGIRQIGFQPGAVFENYWSSDFFNKITLTRTYHYQLFITFMNNWYLLISKRPGKEFDRVDNVLYDFPMAYYIFIRTNTAKSIYFSGRYYQGKYRTGYNWVYQPQFTLRFNNRINLNINLQKSLVKLVNPGSGKLEKTYYELWRTKFQYFMNRDLNARVIFQYDRFQKKLDTSYLISWNFRPKSHLYLVYTECFDDEMYTDRHGIERIPHFSSSNKVFQLKWSYLFYR